MSKILCGINETIITPKELGLLPGYYEKRIATEIIDDLCAKTVLFYDGKTLCGIVELDLCWFLKHNMKLVRDRVEKILGIDASNIMIASTHTHTGASMDDSGFDICVATKDEIEYLVNKIVESIVNAYKNLQEFKIGFDRTEEFNVSFNRRWWMKDGAVHTWPGVLNPDNIKPAADIDPEIDVVKIESIDGKLLAVITNFANHLDTVGKNVYCSDFPGVLSKNIKNEYGNDVVSIFMNGCCGDITHVDYSGKFPLVENQYELIGNTLYKDVKPIISSIKCENVSYVNSIVETITVGRRQIDKSTYLDSIEKISEYEKMSRNSDEKLDQSDEEFAKPTTGDLLIQEMSYCYAAKELYENPKLYEDLSIQVIRVGDIVFNSMPGEMLNELGKRLKSTSKYSKNIMVELANGYHSYIATEKAYSEGGYETTLDYYMNLEEKAGDKIIDKLLEIQNRI